MNATDLAHLRFLANTQWGLPSLRNLLYDPHVGLLRSASGAACGELYDEILDLLGEDEETIRFLQLHLLTEILLNREECPPWVMPWVQERLHPGSLLGPLDWGDCLVGRWRAVPVIVVHDRACLRYVILGLVPGRHRAHVGPEWADPVMDDEAKQSVLSALGACGRMYPPPPELHPFCYPLVVPNRALQIKGASLGLPLAIGWLHLFLNRPLSPDLAATGCVREDGSIGKVGHLSRKTTLARREGFRVFLHPSDTPAPPRSDGLECLPVSTLREAWTVASLYTPGQAANLILMLNMMNDPLTFADNCARVPREWVAWGGHNGLFHHVAEGIATSPALFETYVRKVETCLERGDRVKAETLAGLLKGLPVQAMEGPAPLSLFKWYTLNLSMANHRGDVAGSERWEKEASRMVQEAPLSDVEAFADFFNHRFIALHHNRYHFLPGLPEFLRGILASLERQYEGQRRLLEGATNKTLGALYGSIAQNYGYCGPRYLEETTRYLRLAQSAFGEGKVPERREDWLRQFNYLVYASLDAGEYRAAEKALMAYLQILDWRDLWASLSRLNDWQHAALARFLADSGAREPAFVYAEWAASERDRMVKEAHPWQLWLHNMGRVARMLGDRAAATAHYQKGLDLCLSDRLGPTVAVMALLPLSRLWEMRALEQVDLSCAEERIRRAAADLNPVHFAPLLNEPVFTKVLEDVWARPEDLFPFTYR